MYNICKHGNADVVSATPTESSVNQRVDIVFSENLTPNRKHFPISHDKPLLQSKMM